MDQRKRFPFAGTYHMSRLRRYNCEGYPYFTTCVTHRRYPILTDHFGIFRESMKFTRRIFVLDIVAWVVLPDHFHFIVSQKDATISEIMRRLKTKFSGLYRSTHSLQSGPLWQKRFWDHVIRDDNDMNRHIDYIHYNPVRHGLVRQPADYAFSSFSKYVEQGLYAADWGSIDTIQIDGDFGE
jgi:putative transposase